MPFNAFYLTPGGELQRELSEEQVSAAFKSNEGVLWVDISDTNEDDGRFLSRVFGFHPLTIEDCVDPNIHTPKADEYEDYLFMILRGIDYTAEAEIVQTTELDLVLGRHYVVSTHNIFLHSIEGVMKRVLTDGGPMKSGPVFLAHALIDALVENITPTIERLGERVDDVEDEILRRPHPSALEAILALKRSSLRLRRALVPQREMLSRASRREFAQISGDAQRYFRDVYDDVLRIEGSNEALRERADNALTMHLTAVANQQNETMRVLSVVATIFLPLTLLAGIYGMNFENMPELAWSWGYFAVLGFMAAVIVGVLWWFWVRRWMGMGAKRLGRFVPTAVDPGRLATYLGYVPRPR
ncbi:MAG: magnesium/cobalt transporter CorA [Chloroflexi bacterium]|nr:magnesium/cobalt transporter CorA [Chloroflexota bacterium]